MQFHTISCQTSVLSARWTCLPGQFGDNSGRKGGGVQAAETEVVCLGDKGQHGQWQGSIPDVDTGFYNIQI